MEIPTPRLTCAPVVLRIAHQGNPWTLLLGFNARLAGFSVALFDESLLGKPKQKSIGVPNFRAK